MLATDLLTSARRGEVHELLEAVRRHDGVAAVDEAGRLALDSDDAVHLLELEADAVVGYAGLLPDGTVQGAVSPEHRRQGRGSRLLEAALARRPDAAVWAHGALPDALALLGAHGLRAVRTLLVLERGFGPSVPLPARRPRPDRPEPVIDAFDPSRDREALLEVNAAAFAAHPEQGSMSAADLDRRQAEPWFRAEDLLVARLDGRFAAFLWMKREPGEIPEIYVVGTAPWAQGQGLAGALLGESLRILEDAGAPRVKLYVEADNDPALALYRRWGFAEEERHVQLRRSSDRAGR